MRRFIVLLLGLVACGEEPQKAPDPVKKTSVLEVSSSRLPKEVERINVDGNGGDPGWRHAHDVKIPLTGEGPGLVTIRSVHNDQYLYFLLIWRDDRVDMGNICRYEKPGVWKMYEGEDALLFFFPPRELAESFRARGFHTFVQDGEFKHPGEEGFADAWYWGAQTTRPHLRARDHWLRPQQRLRGDSQPDNSDNVLNWSAEYAGPVAVPAKVTAKSNWYLQAKDAQSLDAIKMARMKKESNYGWTVPAILHRPFAGSRADVVASSRHAGGVWVVEVARALDTKHRDDHPFDPALPILFALGVYDGTAHGVRVGEYGTTAAVSGAIQVKLSDS
ncbi:MAG: ethylbenzene dehydrogenase-related protein [Planctomycetota bacterium]